MPSVNEFLWEENWKEKIAANVQPGDILSWSTRKPVLVMEVFQQYGKLVIVVASTFFYEPKVERWVRDSQDKLNVLKPEFLNKAPNTLLTLRELSSKLPTPSLKFYAIDTFGVNYNIWYETGSSPFFVVGKNIELDAPTLQDLRVRMYDRIRIDLAKLEWHKLEEEV